MDLDDAVKEVAKLHAETISYGGFSAMVKFIEATFAVRLPVEPATRVKLRRIIAVRNMIAHNHSRKNARYCKDVGEPLGNVGQHVRPSLAEAQGALEDLASFVDLVDSTLRRELLEFRESA